MTVTRDILNSHPVSSLKKELGKAKKSLNYGTLKKSELIDLMLKHKEHFNHIKKYEPPPRKQRQKKFKVGESITFGGATKTKPRKDLVRNEIYETKPKRQKKFKVGDSITFGGATKPKPRKNLIKNPTYQKTGGKA